MECSQAVRYTNSSGITIGNKWQNDGQKARSKRKEFTTWSADEVNRFHDLRYTHTTLLLAAGVHPKAVQERLGHSQISLTLETCRHVIPLLPIEVTDQFEVILG
ncbi:MAG: tyrosine-type recombinase/integrase [Candidatus Promineifilaceae bacterium]|nr:tyrosine-type recombinase/integrase [Candidatus Promineifilaceae bacterium]